MRTLAVIHKVMKQLTIFFLTFLFSCGQKADKVEAVKVEPDPTDDAGHSHNIADTARKIDHEYLDWNSLKINGQLSLSCRKDELIGLLGQPDSIVTPNMNEICASYFDSDFKYVYFGDSQFESAGDEMVIRSVDFERGNTVTLNAGAIILDNSMTIDKLRAIFPKAVRDREEIEIHKKGKADCVRLDTSEEETDDAWLLFFRNAKLIRIDYWIPC